MLKQIVRVVLGSSNEAGFLANLLDLTTDQINLWFGTHPQAIANYPKHMEMPNVRIWQPRLPYARADIYTIDGVPNPNQVDVVGTPFVADDVGLSVFIGTNTPTGSNPCGQGQYKRISAFVDTDTITVDSNWSPAIEPNGTIVVLRDSFRVSQVGGAAIVAAQTADDGTTTTLVDAARVEADDFWNGKYVRFTSGSNNGKLRRITDFVNSSATITFTPAVDDIAAADTYDIVSENALKTVKRNTAEDPSFATLTDLNGRYALFFHAYVTGDVTSLTRKVVSSTADEITFDLALGDAPPIDSAFVILASSGAANTYETFTTGAALRPLALHMDPAPVPVTGYDSGANWDMGTPFQSPRASLGVAAGSAMPPAVIDPTVNSVCQLAYLFKTEGLPQVFIEFGVSACFISPAPTTGFLPGISWVHDRESHDFHPLSNKGLYNLLVAALDDCTDKLAAEGLVPEFEFYINCADNDARLSLYERIGVNMELLRDSLRTHVGDPKAPWIMCGPNAYGAELRPAIYTQLEKMQREDLYTGLCDSRGYGLAEDGAHLNAAGQLQKAHAYYQARQAMKRRVEEARVLEPT